MNSDSIEIETLFDLHTALDNLNIKTNKEEDFLFINNHEKNILAYTTQMSVKFCLLTVHLKVAQKCFINYLQFMVLKIIIL